MVWVRSLRPAECTTMPSPLADYDETRGCRPKNDTGLFIETSFPAICDEQTCTPMLTTTVTAGRRGSQRDNNEPTRGLRQQSAKHHAINHMGHMGGATRSVGGRIEISWKSDTGSPRPDRSTSPPARGGKRGGGRFGTPISGSAAENAATNGC